MSDVAPATLAEAREVAEIFAESFAAEGDVDVHEGRLRAELERVGSASHVARVTVARDHEHGVVAALLAWRVVDEVTLLDVAVREAFRRHGHGRALVRELLEWSRAEGARLVILEVRASNVAARTLYAALGFEEVNVRRRYYEDGEDAVEMHAAVPA